MTGTPAASSLLPAVVGGLVLAAGLAAGLALWSEWGVMVFFKGGGLLC
jgi:hypothetical protein